ncbi:FadR/GntR family transcriptional regulator [Klebsiella quasipneumoniae]|uniref:FadR/GntR family transcriptional regulator n=1 Tax=Klebsiella quasipneumoniae TaxID=1463165 RepID=UPI003DA1A3D1
MFYNDPLNIDTVEPFNRKESLTERLVEKISNDIRSGKYSPGEKLPTEREFIGKYNVSRSVVREAIASLKSDGLLQSRQGIGVFVIDPLPSEPFKISVNDITDLENIALMQELRKAVEIESAGLAAERRSSQQMKNITAAYKKLEKAYAENESDIGLEDFGFHLAVAQATNNKFFPEFLIYLRNQITLGLSIKYKGARRFSNNTYRSNALREHQALLGAISNKDSNLARELMNAHLSNASQYYQDLEKYLADDE